MDYLATNIFIFRFYLEYRNALDLLPTTMLASNDVGGEGQKHSIGKSVDGQSQYSVEDVIFENSILSMELHMHVHHNCVLDFNVFMRLFNSQIN